MVPEVGRWKGEIMSDSLMQCVTLLLDAAVLQTRREQPPRDYLGASTWGEECAKKLAYSWHKTPPDEADPFPPEILRVFDMGHDCEERMAGYIRKAGFTLLTVNEFGKQFGFSGLDGKLSGNCDGIITAGPVDIPYPIVWENKGVGDAIWNGVRKDGLKESKPVYYGQIQTYCAHIESDLFEGPLNGGLFTMIHRRTGKVHAELIPFNVNDAQRLADRALDIVQSKSPEHFPRLNDDPAFFKCCYCDYRIRCHGIERMAEAMPKGPPSPKFPDWLVKAAEAESQSPISKFLRGEHT